MKVPSGAHFVRLKSIREKYSHSNISFKRCGLKCCRTKVDQLVWVAKTCISRNR